MSIGGWTYSSIFGGMAGALVGWWRFAETAVGLVADLGFDGRFESFLESIVMSVYAVDVERAFLYNDS